MCKFVTSVRCYICDYNNVEIHRSYNRTCDCTAGNNSTIVNISRNSSTEFVTLCGVCIYEINGIGVEKVYTRIGTTNAPNKAHILRILGRLYCSRLNINNVAAACAYIYDDNVEVMFHIARLYCNTI